MTKKMYVVQAEAGGYWCGLNCWDVQLRKAQIFHSIKYAGDVVKRFNKYNPKIVEVSLTVVPEPKTNADRIRAMTDEELAELLCSVYDETYGEYQEPYGKFINGTTIIDYDENKILEWLQQPAEGG